MPTDPDEAEAVQAQEAEAALRAGLERAHELVSEAKQRIRPQEEAEPLLPESATGVDRAG
jgi:hypothetical protein